MSQGWKTLRWRLIFRAGLLYTLAAILIRQAEAFLTMQFYMKPEYFDVWAKRMMPGKGPPPAEFFVISLLFTFVSGVFLAAVFDLLRPVMPKEYWDRVLWFSYLVIGFWFVLAHLPMLLLINAP